MKIAYLMIAHNEPAHVFNLVRVLNSNDNAFFIHFKKDVAFEIPADIKALNNVFFAEERYMAGWCGFNVIAANLHLLQLAMNTGTSYDYFINLSGNCFPVYSNQHISKILSENKFNYIEGHPLPYEKLSKGGLSKINMPWFQDGLQNANPYFKKFFHKLIHLPYKLLRIKRKFPKHYVPYFGSQWWALTREAAGVVLQSAQASPKLLQFFRRSWCSDEQYIQTVVYNEKKLLPTIKNEPFRYIDWNTNGAPKTLIAEDLAAILASGQLFMRKITLKESGQLIEKLNLNNS